MGISNYQPDSGHGTRLEGSHRHGEASDPVPFIEATGGKRSSGTILTAFGLYGVA